MVTLKEYFNFPEAALDKTLLEDYEVFCSLFDEYVHGVGYYFAMPVRLMVANGQRQRAARILAYSKTSVVPEDDAAAADDRAAVRVVDEEIFGEDLDEEWIEADVGNNPWEILAIAYLFLVPGIGFLLEQLPLMLFIGGRKHNRFLILSSFDQHLIGATLICFSVLLTVGYFYARQTILGEKQQSTG